MPDPVGFFTDTTVCIGCKACQVACHQWNDLPAGKGQRTSLPVLSGNSYDNTGSFSDVNWRHVKFIEKFSPDRSEAAWLMMSDVCKHCVNAPCLEVCPTGAILRTEFDTVFINEPACNGCRDCITACPFGVIHMSETRKIAQKCTFCYDRLQTGLAPACAQACPTGSIAFGKLTDLQERARQRLGQLRRGGVETARLYGADEKILGGLNSFYLLVDEPETYGLPSAPKVPSRGVPLGSLGSIFAALMTALGVLFAFRERTAPPAQRRRSYFVGGGAAVSPFVADPDWGWWIIGYFYLGGIAAGAYFVACLVELVGSPEDRIVSRIGYRLALPLVSVCGILLIVDLERPERFWHMLLQSEVVAQALAEGWPLGGWGTMARAAMLKWWSPMSIGAWALLLFSLCSTLSFLGTLRPGGWLERRLSRGVVGRLLQLVGTGAGFFLASYTGVLLTATNQPLWGVSSWIGPLFLTSAASTGIAAVLLLRRFGGNVPPATLERLERADLWALGLELLVFLLFLASVGTLLPLALQTWAGSVLVFGTLVLGLLVPLALCGWPSAPNAKQVTAGAACALAGGFLLRYGILRVAPALLAHPEELAAAPVLLWESGLGKGLVVLSLGIAAAVPWFLRRACRLSPGRTAVLGLVALLVAAGVVFHAVTPTTALPVFFSPEDGRPRGGGPGASASNRPQTISLRSKINGTLPDEP